MKNGKNFTLPIVILIVFIVISIFLVFQSRIEERTDLHEPNQEVALIDDIEESFQDSPFFNHDERNELIEFELESKNLSELDEKINDFRNFCNEFFPQYKDHFPTVSELSHALLDDETIAVSQNVHIESEYGQVYRVRRFIDDGQNGEYERLVFYKEDETGFPYIVDIPEEHQVNPSEEIIAQYLAYGEKIFTQETYLKESDEQSFLFEFENDELIRVDVATPHGIMNCQKPFE